RTQGQQTVPDRVLTLPPAHDQTVRFFEAELFSELGEGRLHRVAHDDDDLINACGGLEPLPRMSNDGTASHLQEQLIHIRPHADATACGDDDSGGHCIKYSCPFVVPFAPKELRRTVAS